MRLSALAEALRATGTLARAPDTDVDVRGVTDDSRRVEPGSLFCAVEGTAVDGHAFVADAVGAGAVAIVVRRTAEASVPQIVVRDTRIAVATVARAWYGDAASRLRLIGVTGTNGKTTTVALIRHLVGGDGRMGSVGTLGAYDGAGHELSGIGSLTTPGAFELHAALAELERRACATVVMEASSHALDQRRLHGLAMTTAVFTNLTQDHLDYHPSMAAYRDVKLRLASHLVPDGAAVVNADDPAWVGMLVGTGTRVVRFGRAHGTDVRIGEAVLDGRGATLSLTFDGRAVETAIPLLGEFNVTNAAGAAAAAWVLGEPPDLIAERLRHAPQVPGRMEKLVEREFVILRDYAHTPDALDRAIAALRPITPGRLIVLFGAGGDRDRTKRPLMGAVVAARADLAIVTSDNPRTEDPERIIDEIEAGMGAALRTRIGNRREAIYQAVRILHDGDCLLLAGKGHETYQVVGRDRIPFDERAIVDDALHSRDAS